MKQYRLNRLFDPTSQRCLNVAVDHGFFGEGRFLQGIENMDDAVSVLIDAAPDAIQLTVGQAHRLQRTPGKDKPALALRTDVANIYGAEPPAQLFSEMIHEPVRQALILDAACVVVNLLEIPGHPEVLEACVKNILAIKPETDRWAMPLMIEPLVMAELGTGQPYGVNGDPERIVPLVRQAAELGADLIKADPTTDVDDYHRVIEAAGVPVLVRGGGRVPELEILQRTEALIGQGASGVVYGRNIIQHPDPREMTRALLAVVRGETSPTEAVQWIPGVD